MRFTAFTRFSSLNKLFAMGLHIITSVAGKSSPKIKNKVLDFLESSRVDMPRQLAVSLELELWERKWRKEFSDYPSTAVLALLKTLCTLPVTFCESERATAN